METLKDFYQGKTILITGGVGSIGSKIAGKILEYNPEAIRVLDNNETGLLELKYELRSEKIRPLVGDIKDKARLKRAMENTDIVFHTAALKHVPLCEYNPFEAIKTNVLGTQNLIEAAMDEEVKKFILISTDKAVDPVNVMGATKLLAERLTISANFFKGKRKTAFSCVRFGNVLDTRGSVLPLFRKQVENGSSLTITDPNMTRFIIAIPKAIGLVLKAAKIAEGGEVFILKMPVVRIGDLAEVVMQKSPQKHDDAQKETSVRIIGKRAGEKMCEGLITKNEIENAYENEEMFMVLPQSYDMTGQLLYNISDDFKKVKEENFYSKEAKLLTKEEITQLLEKIC